MMSEPRQISGSSMGFAVLSGLFFLSGATGLILQVVWMYRLGLVFGNAAYATAATLAAFFLGLALGGWFWGKASARFKNPLTVYGLMEVGVALTALIWIPGLEFYETHYPSVVDLFGGQKSILTLCKFVFSTTLLLLPTVLMGGTFPVLAQYVGKERHQLASRGTILYAVNTIGASLGAFLAGFFLLSKYGVSSTYIFAVALASGIGIVAIILDRLPVRNVPVPKLIGSIDIISEKSSTTISSDSLPTLNYSQFIILAFASGLLALSTETIWTRMFAQVLQNSVYSFSAILVIFLIALGLGGLLSHVLVRLSLPPIPVLLALLSLGAIAIGFSPVVFYASTNGLGYLASGSSWFDYLSAVFGLGISVVLPPSVVFGAIFPFLLKASPKTDQEPGRFVGTLVLFNALGSTIGPIIVGFILLDAVGLWSSIKIIAVSYGVLALLIAFSYYDDRKIRWMVLPVVGIIGVAMLTNPPIVRLETGQKVLDVWQSSDGVVSIVESAGNIQMKLDNYYTLGDSRSILVEQMQAHIPLMIHPKPKRVLFLGMGTGITAGASLSHDVERVVAVELVSDVIPAAQRYFSPWANGLFEDQRVEIISDDARNFILSTPEQFDVIVGDLFTPWHAGTGSLYTVEHFQKAQERLAPGGLFAQWLPLYQLTPRSFEIIAATFASVFPQVTLWRADFSGSRASIALVGQESGSKLEQEVLQENIVNVVGNSNTSNAMANHMAGLFYLGNLNTLQNRLWGNILNTDDKRAVEFMTPILSYQASAGHNSYMVGKELENFLSTLVINLPVEEDPYLSNLPSSEIRYVEVGLQYFRYQQFLFAGKEREAKRVAKQIRLIAPDFLNKSTTSSNQ